MKKYINTERAARRRARYAADPEKELVKSTRYRDSLLGQYSQVKSTAKKRKIPFHLTFTEYKDIVTSCCVYGERSITTPRHVGLDRINNDRRVGYTFENCLPACSKHNTIRNEWFTFDEMMSIVETCDLMANCGDRKLTRKRQ